MKSKLNTIELNLYFGRPKSLKQAKIRVRFLSILQVEDNEIILLYF